MTTSDTPSPRSTGAAEATPDSSPITMWYANCPFRKTGSPVLGTTGTSVRPVVIFEYDEWLRFAKNHLTIETQQVRVGTFE